MLDALRSLHKRARNAEERAAITKLIASVRKRNEFKAAMKEQYGWDGTTLAELLRIFIENLPAILELILKLVAK